MNIKTILNNDLIKDIYDKEFILLLAGKYKNK